MIASEETVKAPILLGRLWRQNPGSAQAHFLLSRFASLRPNPLSTKCRIAVLRSFTVEPVNLTMRFSQNLQLGESTRAQLLAFHGAGIITPQSTVYRPERRYLEWHGDEVFKKPGRE